MCLCEREQTENVLKCTVWNQSIHKASSCHTLKEPDKAGWGKSR